MGAAGTKGFGPALGRTDVEDAGEDQGIRNGDGEAGHYYVDAYHNENH